MTFKETRGIIPVTMRTIQKRKGEDRLKDYDSVPLPEDPEEETGAVKPQRRYWRKACRRPADRNGERKNPTPEKVHRLTRKRRMRINRKPEGRFPIQRIRRKKRKKRDRRGRPPPRKDAGKRFPPRTEGFPYPR